MAPLRSWLPIEPDSPFSLSNIPFGIISTPDNHTPRAATTVGRYAIDLHALSSSPAHLALPDGAHHNQAAAADAAAMAACVPTFAAPTLNAFASRGSTARSAVRRHLQRLLSHEAMPREAGKEALAQWTAAGIVRRLDEVTMHLPFAIGDYTDFYAGIHHATNCGRLLRGAGNELQPNYRRVPVAYHGRASSVVVSGTGVVRPRGQVVDVPADPAGNEPAKVVLAPCRRLDFELELGCFVAVPNGIGEPVPVERAAERLFGVVLLNDWSARDVQAWEMVPLGPFNAKNFATSVSPWVVTMEALEPFLVEGLESERELLPYLGGPEARRVFDISLTVEIESEFLRSISYGSNKFEASPGKKQVVTETSGRNLIFSFPQMLAHHTVGGCPFNSGDLIGSGTISGTERGSFGSLFEQTEGGKSTIEVVGATRTFLQDGDIVRFSGICGKEPYGLVGFGDCAAVILPAVG
jgi:fumarylacetoacetase